MSNTNEFKNWSSMSPESYIKERVDEQVAWYDQKSATNKVWHYRWQIIALVATAIIPILALYSGDIKFRIAVASLGAVAAIAAGFMSMYQFRDQWVDYRTTAEMLKYERFLFLTGSAPYNGKDSFSNFVHRIESIIIKENSQWRERNFSSEKRADSSDNSFIDPAN